MTRLEKLGRRIGLISLRPLTNKLLILFIKVPVLWLFDKISIWFPFPEYKDANLTTDKKVLDELEKKYKDDILKYRITHNGIYEYKKEAKFIADNGDSCLFSGLLAAYFINIDNNVHPFKDYIKTFIVEGANPPFGLLRGVWNLHYPERDDPSGDQLMGMVHAVSEYKKRTGEIHPRFLSLVNQIIKDGYRLRQLDGTTPVHGNFAPGIMLHGGSAAVILAALAVAEKWDDFDYLYNDCGYKYLLKYASPWVKWRRAWFSDNVAIMALSVIHYEPREKYEYYGTWIVSHAITNILIKNKWNIWLWLIAKDMGWRTHPIELEQGIEYFKTFNYAGRRSSSGHYPLGDQNCDWVWQRNPFKKETNEGSTYGRLDFLYVKGLLDKYKLLEEEK